MSNFWMALLAAQSTAGNTKPANRRHRILSIVGGIALALLIGAGLFVAAALTIPDKRGRAMPGRPAYASEDLYAGDRFFL
jgi:hypothetical protein